MAQPDGKRFGRKYPLHHPEFPYSQSGDGAPFGRSALGRRTADADPLPQPAGRPLRAGRKFRRQPRRSALHARHAPAGHLRLVGMVGRHRRGGSRMGGSRPHPAGHHGRHHPHQGHHGGTHHGHDVRERRHRNRRDTSIHEPRRGREILCGMDDGKPRRGAALRTADTRPRPRRGTRPLRIAYQAAQHAAAGRELRPHHGTRHPGHAAPHLRIDHPPGRNSDRLLRPHQLSGSRRTAHRPHGLPGGRPPHPHACLDGLRRRHHAAVRPGLAAAVLRHDAADKHRYRLHRHPRCHRGDIPHTQNA